MSKITTYMDDRNNNRHSAGAPKAGGGPQNSRFWVEISLGSDKRFKTMDDALRLAGERSFRYGKSYWY
jgi:hypothetical protein